VTPAAPAFPARLERFATVESTQMVVRGWLDAGAPEVAVAVADEQTAGRGRLDRTWTAPPGAALLCSIGFRPAALAARHAWRLGAVVSLAMVDAAEDVAGLPEGRLRLKWPNDLVAAGDDGELRKVAGVLGESIVGAAGLVDSAVVGIGVNADWSAVDFPPDLSTSMSSLRELSGARSVDREALLDGFLVRLWPRYQALLGGRFDVDAWSDRQAATGHEVEVADGSSVLAGRASGVDPDSGALWLLVDGHHVSVDAGDVTSCRIAP
jgi:BirA family transcriptional regulator, biotin operon repressor / biotin---[acetyl-CoA-carboxylase] ligase